MPLTQRPDRLLFGATVSLIAVGLAVMGSASWVLASERYHRASSHFLVWQGATAAIGLLLLLVVMHLRTELILQVKPAAIALGVSWLLLFAAYLQPAINHTHRWLNVGGISVQPSVVARLALTLFAAVILARARANNWRLADLALIAVTLIVTAGLVLKEPDLGSAALIVFTIGAMTFVAGVPKRYLVPSVLLTVVGIGAAIAQSAYRLARVKAFFGIGAASADYQSQQSLVAIGSGGLVGRGYGSGLQKLFFLPEPHTDFVFASTAEELGLVGIFILLTLVSIIVWRGMRHSIRQADSARSLLGFGLTIALAIQALLHMMVNLRLLPPKGIPFPLVSYGKTDLLVTLVAMGLLLNLSRSDEARS